MPLNETQVAKAKTFPGCNDLTADNALEKLFAAAESLETDAATAKDLKGKNDKLAADLKAANDELTPLKAKATPPDSNILALVAMAAETEMSAAMDAQAITPALAAELKATLVGDPEKGQYNVAALTAGPGGKPLAVSVFKSLRSNGAMPKIGKDANGQPVGKVAVGAPVDKPISDERLKALLEATPLGQSALAAALAK